MNMPVKNSAPQTAKRRAQTLDAPSVKRARPTKQAAIITEKHPLTFTITDQAADKFIKTAQTIKVNPYQDAVKAGEAAAAAAQEAFPKEAFEALKSVVSHTGIPYVIINNVPISGKALPPTPKHTEEPTEKDRVSELFALGAARALGGVPDNEKAKKSGAISQIIPLKADAYTGEGYRKGYDFHTEAVSWKKQPEYTLLVTLRGDPAAKTGVIGVNEIIDNLPKDTVKILKKPDFIFRSTDAEGEGTDLRAPVLTKNEQGFYQIRFNEAPGRVLPATDAAGIAIKELQAYLKTRRNDGVVLQPRQMLAFSNLTSAHRRGSFERTTAPEENRWLQRYYLREEKPADAAETPGTAVH